MNYTCEKCGRTMKEDNFYTYRDGRKTEMCKKCLTMHIDNFDPETFLWLLEKLDVPYIEPEWNVLRDRAFAKDPHKMNGMSVFGKYLSKMKLNQWKDKRWADTEELARQREQQLLQFGQTREALAEREQELKEQLSAGEISEAEYKTLTNTESLYQDYMEQPPDSANNIGSDNMYQEENFLSEEELPDPSDELTKDDKIMLAMKWGRYYKPIEWVQLEKKYNEMTQSFDIQDSDTEGALILICKTFLKMNQAIDSGDYDGYSKLSRVLDNLRKSAKFTAAQNKEAKSDFLDAVGEMVAYCEQYGGQIPKFDLSVDYDIIDTVIKDLKEYNRSLFAEDPSLARQVEEYIKKRENADNMKRDQQEAKKRGLDTVQVQDDDYVSHLDMIQKDRMADEKIMYSKEEQI